MTISGSQVAQASLIGVGATAVMDLAGEILRRTRGVQGLDYRLVGRWIGHMTRGQFQHESIRTAPEVDNEKAIGWAAHYSIGAGFAVGMVALDPSWLERPTLPRALAMGVGTVAAPWLVMQPAFGMGIAAAKAPNPTLARVGSLRAHTIYGLGVWGSARAVRALRQRL